MATLQHRIVRRIPAAAAALGCALAFAAQAQSQAQETAGTCTVSGLRGPATVLREGGSRRIVQGAKLQGDDQLVTGAKARLRIDCSGGVEVTIGPDSSISMRAIAEAGAQGRSLVELIGGILRIALAPHFPRDRLELRTPTAVAAARSTAWIAEARVDHTAVFVIAGEVSVRSRQTGADVTVPAGFGTDVPASAAPTAPVRWGQPRADRALRETAFP